ncbi:hypothetical protein EYF80_009283 [Liparis tanakae]|uniref:Uncharacterized protein n=1 Tax=Liparis tanakae TaxID=230148 RepID=A0A4Z2ISQ8_9TELE|nr:hypothetical protein EYF80_009283 [Liparis tanakae]
MSDCWQEPNGKASDESARLQFWKLEKNGRTDGYASFTQDARKPFQTLRASTPFSIHPSKIYASIRKPTQACKAVIGLLV